jgi:hypothetical protein
MLYHYQLGIPAHVRNNLPCGRYRLAYTDHAKRAARSDRYGPFDMLPSHVNTERAWVIEVEAGEDGVATKVLYRVALSSRLHICLAVRPQGREFVVKTVWGQEVGDDHSTLRKERYANAA